MHGPRLQQPNTNGLLPQGQLLSRHFDFSCGNSYVMNFSAKYFQESRNILSLKLMYFSITYFCIIKLIILSILCHFREKKIEKSILFDYQIVEITKVLPVMASIVVTICITASIALPAVGATASFESIFLTKNMYMCDGLHFCFWRCSGLYSSFYYVLGNSILIKQTCKS